MRPLSRSHLRGGSEGGLFVKEHVFKTAEPTLKTYAKCPCGRFEHRQELVLVAAIGFFAFTSHCRRCNTLYLLVFRTLKPPCRTQFVKAVPITGKNEAPIRAALRKVPGITDDDIEFMVAVASTTDSGG